jgi:hypothetical protein
VTVAVAEAPWARRLAEHRAEAVRRYSRPVWWLLHALDILPAAVGERLLGALFVARVLVHRRPLALAWRWTAAHRAGRWGRARLALATLQCQGRFVARSALVGVRGLAPLGATATVRGGEQLAAPGAKILVGFHLGAPCCDLVLRAHGRRVSWVGGARASRGWERVWRELGAHDVDHMGLVSEKARLYEAYRRVTRCEAILLNGDGFRGTRAFTVPVLGAQTPITAGWLALRRRTHAPAFPVLAHVEGPRLVVTIHPPLPPPQPDAAADAAACRAALTPILDDFVRRHPEQCLLLAFHGRGGSRTSRRRRPRAGPKGRVGRPPRPR